MPRSIAALEADVRAVATRLVDAVANGTADIAQGLSWPLRVGRGAPAGHLSLGGIHG